MKGGSMPERIPSKGSAFPMRYSSGLPIRWVESLGLQLYHSLAGKISPSYLRLIDPQHPINSRMSLELPGAYRHSLLISCATAITAHKLRLEFGAKVDPDVARVMGLFHDIGKLTAPEFFGGAISGLRIKACEITNESQLSSLLNHPTASAMICYDYNEIPPEVTLGIQQHHGTMKTYAHITPGLVEYLMAHGGDSRFRYPGPKPQSIEAALVMIADGAEALLSSKYSRGEMPAPITRRFIKQVVWQVCVDLSEDGQLSESGLTGEMTWRAHELIMWTYYRYYHDYDLVSTPIHLRKEQGGLSPKP